MAAGECTGPSLLKAPIFSERLAWIESVTKRSEAITALAVSTQETLATVNINATPAEAGPILMKIFGTQLSLAGKTIELFHSSESLAFALKFLQPKGVFHCRGTEEITSTIHEKAISAIGAMRKAEEAVHTMNLALLEASKAAMELSEQLPPEINPLIDQFSQSIHTELATFPSATGRLPLEEVTPFLQRATTKATNTNRIISRHIAELSTLGDAPRAAISEKLSDAFPAISWSTRQTKPLMVRALRIITPYFVDKDEQPLLDAAAKVHKSLLVAFVKQSALSDRFCAVNRRIHESKS